MENNKRKIGPIIGFLIMLWIFSIFVSFFYSSSDQTSSGNVAVIKVYGAITTIPSDSYFESGTAANNIIGLIEKASKDPSIKAIVLDINSGGGSPVASDEIGNKISSIQKPTVAWIRDIGASGAYWIASNTDQIIANRMSLVGSIGVTGSYIEFAELLNKYNLTYRRLVSGKYKDTGTPFRELEADEEELLMDLINELHGYFVEEVAKNRNLSVEFTSQIATGEVFSGKKSLDLGLIDQIGGINEVRAYLEDELNITVAYTVFEEQASLVDVLRNIINEQSFAIGQGIGSFLNKEQPLVKI